MKIIITAENAGITVFTLIRRRLGYSHSYLKNLKFSGRIKVNGESVTVRYLLKEGDSLMLDDSDKAENVSAVIEPVELPLEIVYEDADITVVNKPPYMPTHPSHRHHGDTLANALAYLHRDDEAYIFRPVNRLDRNTSGLVLIANNRYAASILSASIAAGKVHKKYVALLEGRTPQKSGMITGCIKRQPDSIIMRMLDESGEGDYSETLYNTLVSNERYSLVAASPLTGRTHQLRVSFASVGAPIAGDDLYGGHIDLIKRQALHAVSLNFEHPHGGCIRLLCPPPDDFIDAAAAGLDNTVDIKTLIMNAADNDIE